MSTSLVILEDSSSYEGLVKSRVRWMPALSMMEDRVGYCLVMLAGVSLLVDEAVLFGRDGGRMESPHS